MHVFMAWPRPSTKLSLPVFIHGLLNFGLRVHNKWSILRYRFIDWLALQQEQVAFFISIFQRHLLISLELYCLMRCEVLFSNLNGFTGIKVQ